MNEAWWPEAQREGIIEIGAHSWNHVHPAVSEMKSRPDLLEAFHAVRTPEDADLQITQAVRYIRSQAGSGSARLFAYPYGHVSDYLADEYLPRQRDLLAAFTTEGKPWLPDCDPWRIPRYVCGWHFKSEDELRALLTA